MDIKKININGTEFEFICNSRDTRSGFAHDCTLFINNIMYTEAHAYYINRTWERWGYQTVCINAIDNRINDYMTWIKSHFMDIYYPNSYKRMTQKRKAAIEKYINDTKILRDTLNAYKECREKLINNLY